MKRKLVPIRQTSLAIPEITNPFVLEQKLTFLDKLQVAVMSVTVAPVRLIILFFLLLLAWLLATVGIAFLSKEKSSKPLSRWRMFLQRPVVALAKAMHVVSGFYGIKTKGKQASVHATPLLVCAPHSSMFDTLLFFQQTPMLSPVSRIENSKIPLFGSIVRLSQPLLVQRDDPHSRVNTIKEIERRGQSGGQWPQIIIFPEGTCTNRSCLISFKQGAFYSGLPVQPVCVKYPNKLDTATWTWQGPGALVQVWLTLCQFYTRLELEYLPVYIPNEAEKKDPRLFANNVRATMAECLQLPVTDHTFDDCRLMLAAEKLNLPSCVGLVEFEKLHSKLGIDFEEMQDLLRKFNEIKRSTSRKERATSVSYDMFSEYLLLPKSEFLHRVFDMYDRDGSGTIDFREYVIGLSLVSAPVNNSDTIELAFELFDTDNNGYISKEELQSLLGSAFFISEEDSLKMFQEIDTSHDGRITLDEFKNYAARKPEYARIFTAYREFRMQGQQLLMNHTSNNEDFDQWGPEEDLSTKKLQ